MAIELEGNKVDVGKEVVVGGAMAAMILQLPSVLVLTAGSAKLATNCSGKYVHDIWLQASTHY